MMQLYVPLIAGAVLLLGLIVLLRFWCRANELRRRDADLAIATAPARRVGSGDIEQPRGEGGTPARPRQGPSEHTTLLMSPTQRTVLKLGFDDPSEGSGRLTDPNASTPDLTAGDDDSGVCALCMERKATVWFLPCRHRVCCRQCSLEINRRKDRGVGLRCPICRGVVDTFVHSAREDGQIQS